MLQQPFEPVMQALSTVTEKFPIMLQQLLRTEEFPTGLQQPLEPVMQALSTAIEEFPIMNSSLNSKADALLQHSSHNIGVAMATPAGLVVPNIKNVQQRNVASIAAELARLQKDAAIGRVNQADVTGGTISISNIGEVLCCVWSTHASRKGS